MHSLIKFIFIVFIMRVNYDGKFLRLHVFKLVCDQNYCFSDEMIEHNDTAISSIKDWFYNPTGIIISFIVNWCDTYTRFDLLIGVLQNRLVISKKQLSCRTSINGKNSHWPVIEAVLPSDAQTTGSKSLSQLRTRQEIFFSPISNIRFHGRSKLSK